MATWIEALEKAATNFAAWVLDLIEGVWKKATAPKDE